MTYWLTRSAEIADLDEGHEDFDKEWLKEYREAFITSAVLRGWAYDKASDWAYNAQEYALTCAAEFDYDPRKSAECDVMACEMGAGE